MEEKVKNVEVSEVEAKLAKEREKLESERVGLESEKNKLSAELRKLEATFEARLDEKFTVEKQKLESRLKIEKDKFEADFEREKCKVMEECEREKSRLAEECEREKSRLAEECEREKTALVSNFEKEKSVLTAELNAKFSREFGEKMANFTNEQGEILAAERAKLLGEFRQKQEKAYEEFLAECEAKKREFLSEFEEKRKNLTNEETKLTDERAKFEAERESFWQKCESERAEKLAKADKECEEKFSQKEKELNKKEANLKDEREEFDVKVMKFEREKSRFDEDLKEEKERLRQEQEAKISSLESAHKNDQNVITKQNEEIVALRQEVAEFERSESLKDVCELKDAQDNIVFLSSELDKKTKEFADFKHMSEFERDELKSELYRVKGEFASLEMEHSKTQEIQLENASLKQENKSVKERLEHSESELENLRSIYTNADVMEKRVNAIKNELYKEEKNDKFYEKEKNEIEWLGEMAECMKSYGVSYPKRLLYAFHTALKSASFSPLTVLSGVSGTGKSELPKLYAYFGGLNFLATAVQPNWDSPESMMGYFNTVENRFDSTEILKFIVQTTLPKEHEFSWKNTMNMILLDEINLAHIELYFAEFLSKFEQRRGSKDVELEIKVGAGMNMKIELLKNILWIGTMNDDETTKSLSDKVLDRSFCINFPRPSELLGRKELATLNNIKPNREFLTMENWAFWVGHSKKNKNLYENEIFATQLESFRQTTNEINEKMSKVGRSIGHRVWQSMEAYVRNHVCVMDDLKKKDDERLKQHLKQAYEEQVVQKIMPKLKGIETGGKESETLEALKKIISDNGLNLVSDFESAMENPYGQFIWNSAKYLDEEL